MARVIASCSYGPVFVALTGIGPHDARWWALVVPFMAALLLWRR